MGLNNSESSSNDILDKALDDLIKDENEREKDGRNVSSDELINAIFDEDDLSKNISPESLPSSPRTQEMDSISNETGDILDEALGTPKEEPVTLLDDEFFSDDAGIDAMLDGTGEMLPTADTEKSQLTHADSEVDRSDDKTFDDELDAILDESSPSESSNDDRDDSDEELDAMLNGPDLTEDESSDDGIDALLDEPKTTEEVKLGEGSSDAEPDALLNNPVTTDASKGEEEESDAELDALLNAPDLTDNKESDGKAASVEDESSDDELDALLNEPVTTDTSKDEEEESDAGLDAMLSGPDLTGDEEPNENAAPVEDESSDDELDALLNEPATTDASENDDEESDAELDAMLNAPDLTDDEDPDESAASVVDESSDDELDALLNEPVSTDTSKDEEEENDAELDAMLNAPDLSDDEETDGNAASVVDESADDELDALLNEPATTDASKDEEEESDAELDAMLNDPDLTDDEKSGGNAASADDDSDSSAKNVDVSDLLSEFGDDESNDTNNQHEQHDYLDLDGLDGVASSSDGADTQGLGVHGELRGASEFESMLDSASEIEKTSETSTPSEMDSLKEVNTVKSPKEMDATNDSKIEKGKEPEMKTTKGSLALIITATLLSGAAGLAGGIFGPSLMHEFGVKTPGADASQLISNDVIAIKRDLTTLKSEIKDVTASNSNAIVRLREDISSVKSGQQELTEKHAAVTENINNLESGMGQFEIELVKRVEALLTLVEKATDSNRTMNSDVKETVLREIVQLIEEGGINGVSAQMAKALEDFKNKANEVSQLQDMVTGLRNLTTMTNAEMKYLSSRLGKLEQQPTVPHFTSPEATVEEPVSVIDKPVSVYVDTEKKKVKPEPKEEESKNERYVPPKQFVLGVHEVKRGEYIIYLQREGDSDTQFTPYRFSQSQAPIVPGYGRITGVSKVNDPTLMIDHVVSTEGGLITGKKRSGEM